MSVQSWHASLLPKVSGTWNLHNALRGHDQELDFFLMMSSKYGSVGHATQSNYYSANAFLDAFASYRRQLGLPATSLGLGMVSEVGYIHDHPDIEAALNRKGVRPITEEDLTLLFDIALSNDVEMEHKHQPWNTGNDISATVTRGEDAHILTGFELLEPSADAEHFLEANDFRPKDPRGSIMVRHLVKQFHSGGEMQAGAPDGPEELVGRIRTAAKKNNKEIVGQIAQDMSREKLGDMLRISTPETELGDNVILTSLGLDSMLGAEIRTWIWRTFGVDVPFFLLLEAKTTLGSLVDFIVDALMKKEKAVRE